MINVIKDDSWTSGKLVRCTKEEETLVRLGKISICTNDVDGFSYPIGCSHHVEVVCYYYYDEPVKFKLNGKTHMLTGMWRWEPIR